MATYIDAYQTLVSSGTEVTISRIEGLHRAMASSLHSEAKSPQVCVSAFLYSVERLPVCMERVNRVLLSPDREGLRRLGLGDIDRWDLVSAPARRRRYLFDGVETAAAFISSISDIDDLLPALCAFQIEWNKMHALLRDTPLGADLQDGSPDAWAAVAALRKRLGLSASDMEMLMGIWGKRWRSIMTDVAAAPKELRVVSVPLQREQVQEQFDRWWEALDTAFAGLRIGERPLYLVSGNIHGLANLVSGFAQRHGPMLTAHALERGGELVRRHWKMLQGEEESTGFNLRYFAQRTFFQEHPEYREELRTMETEAGVMHFYQRGLLDMEARLLELRHLRPGWLDARLHRQGLEKLKDSPALILNVEHPLGFSAYYLMSCIAARARGLRGLYVMGKSAAMIGRLGDILIPSVVRDFFTGNRYLFRNCFSVRDLLPYLQHIAVFEDQRSLTVRGAFLHNRDGIGPFIRDDFTGIEMEAGPYLSALYELLHRRPSPWHRTLYLRPVWPFDIGLLHYTSDTPYNLRASLLSKHLGYTGVEATYASSLAILDTILKREISGFGRGGREEGYG